MKETKAILRPRMLQRVMDALHALPHFPGVTVSDCQGQGRGRGVAGPFDADQQTVFFETMKRLEVFCSGAVCDELVNVIRRAANTGNVGDGVIGVADLSPVVRVRTDQRQDAAV